ncbi:MAG TPA: DUF4397 domain-containing protein [Acidobacteriota bacterium]|nr:DUF4397 domain-containing protein [Acidobacteriota bacterium]
MNRLFGFLALAMLALAAPLFAQSDTATVYVIHGIPGTDIGAPRALPVDVSVDGSCALKNFTFGNIVGPVTLPAGTVTVKISLASTSNPCGGATALGPVSIKLKTGENASIIASLTADGKPTVRKYTNDTSKAFGGRAKVAVHHTAYAPKVDVSIDPKSKVNSFRNGEKFVIESDAGTAQVSIAPAGSSTPVFGPISVTLVKNTNYLVYAVGSVANNTFTLLLKSF